MKKSVACHKLLTVLIIAFTAIACNPFLGVNPSSELNTTVDSEEKIAELLAGAYPRASYIPFLEARTDNVAERPYGQLFRMNEAMYYWEDYDQDDLDSPLNYWRECYRGIAVANQALELLKTYKKTDRVKKLYGEAFLLRAYLHYMLVNIWAEPFRGEESKQIPALPYMEKPERNALVNYKRGNLWDYYQKIEADLKYGITLVGDDYKHPKYHFNKKAAYAFAARFYLTIGRWQQAVEYSNFVLGVDPKPILKDWFSFEKKYRFNRTNLYKDYTSVYHPSNLLLTTVESRWARDLVNNKYGTTLAVMREIYSNRGFLGCTDYEKVDLQVNYLFIVSPHPIQDGVYSAKFEEWTSQHEATIRPRNVFNTNILFSTDEVLLIRMEALTMLHQYDAAIDDLLTFLQGKYHTTPPCSRDSYTVANSNDYNLLSPYYGLTQKQLGLLKLIVDFRQKEFLQEGLRWFDIRRFYIPVKRVSRYSLYRALEKDDPRRILQLPTEAIHAGLEPNPRTDLQH